MFEGIITPIVTPFNRDKEESINYEATEKGNPQLDRVD